MLSQVDPAELPQASCQDHPADHYLEAHCPRCNHATDAVCPECGSHVEPAGAMMVDVNSYSALSAYRRFHSFLQSARNAKLTLACYYIAVGDAFADGRSMTDVARELSVKKATVSKHCIELRKYLGLPPSQYMRSEETAAKFRLSNRRKAKIQIPTLSK